MSGPATAQPWRGLAAEEADEVTAGAAALLRGRSRRLLAGMLRGERGRVALTMALIVVASLAALAGPWLVGVGIDRGIPPLASHRDPGPLLVLTAAFAVTVAVQAVATRSYIYAMGRLGEAIVLDLRRRLFAHFGRLSVSFHEDYTSGRVISRQTSDIDAISELFSDGLDSLVSAVLSLVLVGAGMLLLDWPLGLVVLAGFGPLAWLTAWFRRESAIAYRRGRESIAQVIVQFVETMTGIRAVQAFRRERRNDEIFGELNAGYYDASLRSFRLVALYAPGITLVGNIIAGVVLGYGGLRVIDGDIKVGVLVSFLLYLRRFFQPLQDLAQFYNSFQAAGAALEKISGVLAQQVRPDAPELARQPGVTGAGPVRPAPRSRTRRTLILLDGGGSAGISSPAEQRGPPPAFVNSRPFRTRPQNAPAGRSNMVFRGYHPSQEAEDQHAADAALADKFPELLEAARTAEARLRQARARRAPLEEQHDLGQAFDAALTEAMRSAYAAQRAAIGPRGYDDPIYRRKAMATAPVKLWTREAEALLTLREAHRLGGIVRVPSSPAA